MKKLIYLTIALSIAFTSYGQYDPEALAILDAMSAKYKKIGAYQADFTYKMVNENVGINEESQGTITIKNNKYLLKIAGQEIYNNGTETYSYSEEMGEVTISTYDPEEQEITLGNIYDLYKSGFKYILMAKNASGDNIVELDPIDKGKSYHKIRLVISSNNELKQFTIFEKSGNQYVYSVDTFTPKSNISDDYFTFNTNKHPDVEVIDFR